MHAWRSKTGSDTDRYSREMQRADRDVNSRRTGRNSEVLT